MQVCKVAGQFLAKYCFLRIDHKNPQVALREELYMFMLRRRQVHKLFDMLRCDTWMNIVERNGFAGEKNFVLKDCYLTLRQLTELESGLLMKKIVAMEKMLLQHYSMEEKQGAAP